MHTKNVNFPSGFLCSFSVEGETKEAFSFYNVFLHMKRKPVKEIPINFFLSICSTHALENLGKSKQKLKTAQN